MLALVHQDKPCHFVVGIKYSFQDQKNLYMVMNLVSGGELYDHMEAAPEFPVPIVRFYCAELILALEALHSKRIIYRDLKAENVMIGADGHIVVVDLGLAKCWKPNEDPVSRTTVGTPEYMPPEMIQDDGYSFPSDWWALGVLTHEMLLCYSPFDSEEKQKLFINILNLEPK
jgi:serine/threonine protein kinase